MATPYMGLDLPTPTVTFGPAYASQNNTAFETIDSHDHTPGKGAPVPTAGLAINADLPFGGFNATELRSTRMSNHGSPLGEPSDLVCMYASAGNLYWNNESGQQIQLTAGGALNAASVGGIGGDYATSTASLFYTLAQTKFTFWQGANIAAFVDAGATTIRDTGASANGVTLTAPSGLAASYALTFPSALPGATKIMTIAASGAIGAVYDVDNSSLEVSSNTIRVKDLGVTTAKLAAGAVTRPKVATVNYGISSSSGTYSTNSQSLVAVTNLSQAITTTGGAVMVMLQPDNSGGGGSNVAQVNASIIPAANLGAYIDFRRDGVSIALQQTQGSTTTSFGVPPSSFRFLDTGVIGVPGTYTYTVYTRAFGSSVTVAVSYTVLLVYEKV